MEHLSPRLAMVPQRQKAITVDPQLTPKVMQIPVDQKERKSIVPGRHGSVGGKHGGALHFGHRLRERHARGHELARTFESDEGRVALVEMPHLGSDSQGAQHPHATDPQNDFLEDAHLQVSAVEAGRQLTIPRSILFDGGVHEIKGRPADTDMPNLHINVPFIDGHGDQTPFSLWGERRHQRRLGPVEMLVYRLLAAIDRKALVKISLRIHEPDPNERHSEIARLFAMVTGKDT